MTTRDLFHRARAAVAQRLARDPKMRALCENYEAYLSDPAGDMTALLRPLILKPWTPEQTEYAALLQAVLEHNATKEEEDYGTAGTAATK